jgi:signal transduction histidine kinase
LQHYNILLKKASLIVGFFFIFCKDTFSQKQAHLDSLVSIYESGNYKKHDKLKILKEIVKSYTDPEKKLAFSDELIKAAKEVDSTSTLCVGYIQKGNALKLKGDNSKALENYFEGARIAKKEKQKGALYITIADVYSIMGNHHNAVNYYQKAITILKNDKDSLQDDMHAVNIATALYNLGDEYLKNDELDSALNYTKESKILFNRVNDQAGEAYSLGSLGIIYSKKGNHLQAEQNLNKAIGLLEELNEYNAICEFLISMSDIFQKKWDNVAAKNYAGKSLELALKYGLKKEISDANLKLSELYEKTGNQKKSLTYYKDYVSYRDSVHNIEAINKMADLRTDFEVSKKQKEVDLLATRNKLRIAERNGFIFAFLLLAAILAISVNFYTQRAKRSKLINAQKMQEAEILHQKNLMQSVISSQEVERKRIGMDLHDEVGAALSTLRIKIEQHASNNTIDADITENYKTDIDKIIANMRNISHALSPRISGNFGFYDAVHELSDSVNRSGKISMVVHFDEQKLPTFTNEQASMALYRVIAELINNTLKHAKATNIELVVDVSADVMNINYSDNGIGIKQKDSTQSKGIGMQNIESRLGIIAASWQIQKLGTRGYGVTISVPLK